MTQNELKELILSLGADGQSTLLPTRSLCPVNSAGSVKATPAANTENA